VVVTSEGLVLNTVESVGSSFFNIVITTSKLPDGESLISGTGNKNGWFFVFFAGVTSNDGGNPIVVTFEVTNVKESGISV